LPNQVIYVRNPAGGEVVDPTDSSSPYFDNEYGNEFGTAINSGIPQIQTVNSVWVGSPLPFPGPIFKWVRITAATEQSLRIDVDAVGGPDGTTPLYYNAAGVGASGKPTGSLTATPGAVQALEVTSMALLPNGSQKILQYVVARTPIDLPPIYAALTLDGSGVNYSGPAAGAFKVQGLDQYSPGPGCVPSATSVYAVGYSDSADQNLAGSSNGMKDEPANYTGNTAVPPPPPPPAPPPPFLTSPDVDYVGSMPSGAPSKYWKDPGGWNALLAELKSNADVVLAQHSTPASALPTTMTPTNPLVVYVDGDLDLSGWNSTGYGLLVVTGQLKYDPGASWYGMVLVAGEGTITSLSASSGTGEIRGALFLARTLDVSNNPLPPLGPLGPTSFNFNTAPSSGGAGISYSSCWIQAALLKSGYKKLSFREIIPQ